MVNPLHQNNLSALPPHLPASGETVDYPALILTEYGDYECPDCARCHFIIKDMQQRFGARLHFIFRHFPQSDRHPHAQNAAEAAETAAAQGKFWQMHEFLAEHPHALTDADLVEYAIWSSLDLPQFLHDMSYHTFAQQVGADQDAGMRRGVIQAPTFYVSSPYWDGEWELTALLTARPYTNEQFELWLPHLQLLVSSISNQWLPSLLPKAS